MTSHLEKLRRSEEQRTRPRLVSPLASSPAVLLEPPARTPPPRKDPGAVCFPASQHQDCTCGHSAPFGDADFGCPWGCDTYFTQNKDHSWGYLHSKSHYKGHETQQPSPSDTVNARLPLFGIPEETSLGAITTTIHPFGDGPEEFILLQSLFYCFSSGGTTKKQSFEDAEGCHYTAPTLDMGTATTRQAETWSWWPRSQGTRFSLATVFAFGQHC